MPLDKSPSESPASGARRLMRSLDRATLATSLDGWPYASLVLTALDHAAHPLLLLSDLAEHTKNLKADARASLLFDGTAGRDDPLTGARVTVVGRIKRLEDKPLMARFCARHPSAQFYAGFKDFNLYRLVVERAHLVAGFGKIDWVEASALLTPTSEAGALAEAEAEIVAHMNEDHGEAVELYATKLLGLEGGGWVMTGVDPEGLDLRRGGAVARVDFREPVKDAMAARSELVRLAGEARRR